MQHLIIFIFYKERAPTSSIRISPNWRWIVVNLAMHGLPTADNNSIRESMDYTDTPAFFEVLCHVCMCNSCRSEVADRLKEHNNKGTVESLGSSEDTDTDTVQFIKLIHIFMQSCHVMPSVFCMLSLIILLHYLLVGALILI